MIKIESTRFSCDSCNEVKQGKIIIVSLDNYSMACEAIQLCDDCVKNLKQLLNENEQHIEIKE